MPVPSPSPAVPPCPSRRTVLRATLGTLGAGLLGTEALTACGPVALGGPEEYTPPPPGIDDLYRNDLLALLDRAIAGADALLAAQGGGASDGGGDDGAIGAEASLTSALSALTTALPVQRDALLTGAQQEREAEAAEDPGAEEDVVPVPVEVPGDIPALLAVLVELRDLAADGARQVSGSLARPLVAVAARTAWSARRLQTASGQGEVSPSPVAADLVPQRDVPQTDPPSVGAQEDYFSSLERAQQEEWYAGYVHEVLAARTDGDQRTARLDEAELHRTRAAELAGYAEEDGGPVVVREAVYALPGGTLDDATAALLPARLAQGLLVDHTALVGAAPFERRALSIAAALAEAELLAGLVDGMDPLPGLVAE
ncbi:DUF4439 domain-containing protein [Brachybacterium aquaticum]|uniref:DUF4439 domain-containing protein n=1 Tax=Brachybacterium aquaticum TaxID=1432564 RepID=A0A841AFF6_9MICO|nr:DUF4439 domain-containing protein [Brachybacterium aquaticum]MBB5832055.1 hypothetical protein [Brachybacterium aquaticum]